MMFVRYILAIGASIALAAPMLASERPVPTREGLAFYEQKIKPILVANCYQCHSHAAKKTSGGLTVDSLAGLLAGGDSGAAIEPGKPDDSLLIMAVGYKEEGFQMPPDGKKLPDEHIALLRKWVEMGAPAPGDTAIKPREKITDEDRAWWAFQPLGQPQPPAVSDSDWCRNDIDRFILSRLEREQLKPAPEADRVAIARRLYFDLTGLPPSPEEVEAFANDPSSHAYEELVDRLLASPRYGERWARHWLDLVRYAESDGFRIDDYRPNAWRYRDYVIRAFNDDKPYDRFVMEQLAGDEIAPDDPDALAATAFLRHTIYEYNQRDVRTQWSDMLNDLTDVTGDVFLGMGMGCARCHDHKFDPILQADYFRLQSFFAAFLPRDDVPLASAKQIAEHRAASAEWEKATADVRRELDELEGPKKKSAERGAIEKFPDDLQAMLNKPQAERAPLEDQLAQLAYRQVLYEFNRLDGKFKDEQKLQHAALKRKLAEFDKLKPEPLPMGLTVTDVGPTAPKTLIPKKPNAEPLEPAFLEVLGEPLPEIAKPAAAPNSTGRRTALARWITKPDNRLSTRVIVNRVWQFHFGRGLVATASDFGQLGEKPSHPELLDWLARRFVQDGWSFKKLHRMILHSATYRQSATAPAAELALRKDPENRLLWRANTRRLDAEQIRDAILAVTGELDLTEGGPSADFTAPRRSVYTRVTRNTRDAMLDVFDLPEGFTSTAQRNVTTTPTQALLLFNGQAFLQRAQAFAKRLQSADAKSDEDAIRAAWRLTYGRAPRPEEISSAQAFLKEQARKIDPAESGGPGFYGERMPYREGKAAWLQVDGLQNRLQSPDADDLPEGDLTIEAFILLRSLYEDGSPRVIASHWSGDKKRAGWSFGVTSKKSAFKPQTLVLQLWDDAPADVATTGAAPSESPSYEPIFSGLHIALDKPYFVAVTVRMGETSKEGITFYAKDLSNDDEPMLSAQLPHKVTRRALPKAQFTIGGHDSPASRTWDGLIDDVRLTGAVLRPEQLLLTAEGSTDSTIGYWQFEANPNPYHDASGHGHDLRVPYKKKVGAANPRESALIDLCHVLLNSNEFLYVD